MNSKLEDGMTKSLWKIWTWLSTQVCKTRNFWKWAWGNNEWSFINYIANNMFDRGNVHSKFYLFAIVDLFWGRTKNEVEFKGVWTKNTLL